MLTYAVLLLIIKASICKACPGININIFVPSLVPSWTFLVYINPPVAPTGSYALSAPQNIPSQCYSGGNWCVRLLNQNNQNIYELWGQLAPIVAGAYMDRTFVRMSYNYFKSVWFQL
uniref:Uncharacterized protein n=1 Tax=Ditylenchus dipsaci TaxID=166011 RepID=A0A915EU85_9BILA